MKWHCNPKLIRELPHLTFFFLQRRGEESLFLCNEPVFFLSAVWSIETFVIKTRQGDLTLSSVWPLSLCLCFSNKDTDSVVTFCSCCHRLISPAYHSSLYLASTSLSSTNLCLPPLSHSFLFLSVFFHYLIFNPSTFSLPQPALRASSDSPHLQHPSLRNVGKKASTDSRMSEKTVEDTERCVFWWTC